MADTLDTRGETFRYLRRAWVPGFTLVSRHDLLINRLKQLQESEPESSLLDAWLDLARFNYRSELVENKVVWKHDRPSGAGWLVPIPIGYGALSKLYEAGEVLNTRDSTTPFRFIESLYSIGQWISPYRLQNINELFWWPENDPDSGLYLCRNGYVAPPMDEGEFDIPSPTPASSEL